MDFLKKNKIVVAIVVVIIVVLGGFMLLRGGSNDAIPTQPDQAQTIKQMAPSDIGLELSLNPAGTQLTLTVTKVDGIKSMDYEISYDARVTDEGETVEVPRGTFGALKIENGQATSEADLGTCSSGKCKYDTVIGPIKVVIKVVMDDGTIGSVEDSIDPSE